MISQIMSWVPHLWVFCTSITHYSIRAPLDTIITLPTSHHQWDPTNFVESERNELFYGCSFDVSLAGPPSGDVSREKVCIDDVTITT